MGASAFVEQNDVSQRLQRPVVRVRRVPRDVAQRGRLEGGSIANGSGVSEGVSAAVMLGAGLLACIEPARRALRINPIDALRNA